MSHRYGARRRCAAALAAAFVVAGLPGLAPAAGAGEHGVYDNLERVGAGSFVAAGVAISKQVFPEGAKSAVLATDANFPDALAASSVAASREGPVLFTATSELTGATGAELERILPDGATVYLMGGSAAISERVREQVEGRGFRTQRVAGKTRLETAVAAAKVTGLPASGTVVIARAHGGTPAADRVTGWVDSVSCGGYAARTRTPVLLTETDRLSRPTAQTLSDLGVRRAFVCGGTAAVSDAALNEIRAHGIVTERVSGPTRVETAVAAAQRLFGFRTAAERRYVLVNGWGENYGFGLAASALAAQRNAPILLVGGAEPTDCKNGAQPSRQTLCYLATAGDRVAGVVVVGGTNQVGDAVARAAAAAAGGTEITPLPAPTGVTVVDDIHDNGTRLKVSWKPVSDPDGILTGYNVYVGQGSPTTRYGPQPTVGAGKTQLVLEGLAAGGTYTVAVTSMNVADQESPKSATAKATTVNEPPAPVEGFQATPGDGEVVLTWAKNPDLDTAQYVLQRADAVLGSCSGLLLSWGGPWTVEHPTTSYTDRGEDGARPRPQNGTTYCYRIKAFDRTDHEEEAPWSESGPVTPQGG